MFLFAGQYGRLFPAWRRSSIHLPSAAFRFPAPRRNLLPQVFHKAVEHPATARFVRASRSYATRTVFAPNAFSTTAAFCQAFTPGSGGQDAAQLRRHVGLERAFRDADARQVAVEKGDVNRRSRAGSPAFVAAAGQPKILASGCRVRPRCRQQNRFSTSRIGMRSPLEPARVQYFFPPSFSWMKNPGTPGRCFPIRLN